MNARVQPLWLACVTILCMTFPGKVSAHRLDEYLQATRISLEPDRVRVEINLTPGAEVADSIFDMIDLDRNGDVSAAEEAAYAQHFIDGLSLHVDDRAFPLTVGEYRFPSLAEMRRGEGIIRLHAMAATRAESRRHQLRFANSHRPDIGVYLVNALIPTDKRIGITGQSRDMLQREFSLEYTMGEPRNTATLATVYPPLLGLLLTAGFWVVAKRCS
jgi:hypothetical protein